jgi:hypothetical protein
MSVSIFLILSLLLLLPTIIYAIRKQNKRILLVSIILFLVVIVKISNMIYSIKYTM